MAGSRRCRIVFSLAILRTLTRSYRSEQPVTGREGEGGGCVGGVHVRIQTLVVLLVHGELLGIAAYV